MADYDQIQGLKKRVGDLEEVVKSMRAFERSTFTENVYKRVGTWVFGSSYAGDFRTSMQKILDDIEKLKQSK